ncbi:hypothetical protein N779_10785 [Vibrio coralliilyticus OCN008]|nr:hypothetical protein N779_10785 [Vibrio coralliilyticus OCN008]
MSKMGKQFSELSNKHISFIEQQKLYFVGTAADRGSVNLSPKGGDSLRVISQLKSLGSTSLVAAMSRPHMF